MADFEGHNVFVSGGIPGETVVAEVVKIHRKYVSAKVVDVLEPSPGAPASVYRVRVGQYAAHQEAEHIRQRLEREEDFKPWITQ